MRKRAVSRFFVAWLVLVVGLPPSVLAATVDDAKKHAFETIDRSAEQIALVGDTLFFYAEPGMQEFESTKFLQGVLQNAGFSVELGGGGMPTALWARWGTQKPLILIATEVDALPEGSQTPGEFGRKPLVPGAPGHMEGHNTMGAVAVGAAFAVKRAMERFNIPGSVLDLLTSAD